MIRYVYPRLPGRRVNQFFRIGGNGQANSLFVFARALLLADDHGLQIIDPPWFNLRLATWLHGDKDKRHYAGIFRHAGIRGVRKAWILTTGKQIQDDDFANADVPASIVRVSRIKGIGFGPLVGRSRRVRDLLQDAIRPDVLATVNRFDFKDTVAVHVRRGDYHADWRTPIDWYAGCIDRIRDIRPNVRFLLFSDGTREELVPLLSRRDVDPAFFGCAMADIWAISRCAALIGSCSTFSDWGAYLGQIPTVLPKPPQFGAYHEEPENELVLDSGSGIPEGFLPEMA